MPVLDATPATAMVFHPSGNNVLIVSSAANQIHALDVEMKAPGEWSKRYGAQVAKKLLDFPGGIIGLSLPPSPKSTSIIAYSSRSVFGMLTSLFFPVCIVKILFFGMLQILFLSCERFVA